MRDDGTVAVVGEALVDLMPAGDDDVPLIVPGGSPANVAVGLARLEVPTRFIARMGRDQMAGHIKDHLARNGVDLSHVTMTDDRTAVAHVSLDDAGNAAYDFRVQGAADWGWTSSELEHVIDERVVALHAGSLAMAIPPGRDALVSLLQRARDVATISYDPNCRPILMGSAAEARSRLEALLPELDVIRASLDDIRWLCPGVAAVDIAMSWLAMGPVLVIVTLGGDGALAVGKQFGRIDCAGRPVDVVDTIGAGDAFTSAFLAGLNHASLLGASARSELAVVGADTLRPILEQAIAASSIVCTRSGADPPWLRELDGKVA